jgi:putative pyruvate formate lyase activating enzyme
MTKPKIYSAGIHAGEENMVAGNNRSGMVLFSGCHLKCNFCYTPEVVAGDQGMIVDALELAETCETLLRSGARNLNFISVTHVWPTLRMALVTLRSARRVSVPVILKMSGFESVTFATEMAELADIVIPDFKVMSAKTACEVNLPAHYGTTALHAIGKMAVARPLQFDRDGKLTSGVVVRHLLMPGCDEDSIQVVEALASIQYQGALNLMTCFVDSAAKKLHRASPMRVDHLTSLAHRAGMKVLVDGKPDGRVFRPEMEVVA